jgi:radical SAM protein with 4Fe4S-binding SPASM domain
VFLPTNRDTIIGNVLRDDFGEVWTNTPLLWKLRTREHLETHIVNDRRVGCGDCPDKYICGGCRARAYAYFNGDINAPDIGCLRNKALWERPVRSRLRT